MTKVTLHPALVQYRQDMADMVHQVRQENRLAGGSPALEGRDAIASHPRLAGLLTSPRIERLDLCLLNRGARLAGYIHVNTTDEFGVMDVYVTLSDERGNLLEGGYAKRNEYWPGHWGYMPTARVPSGVSITVHALARDPLGGVGVRSETAALRP